MIPLSYFLMIGAILFVLGITGVIINRKSLIIMLMCIEIMLLGVNTNFIAFAQYLEVRSGELFVFFVLAVAAAESAIGLAILVLFYRRHGSLNVDDINILKG